MPRAHRALPGRAPTVEVLASPAIELIMTLAAFTDRACTGYAVGDRWFAAVARDAGPELVRQVRRFSGGSDMVWAHLVSLAYDSPPPREVREFVQCVAKTNALELKLRLVGHYVRFFRRATPPGVIAAAAAGDAAARRQFLATSYPNSTAWQAALRHLLPLDAAEVRREAVDILRAWNERVFRSRAAALMGPVHADAERIAGLARRGSRSGDVDHLVTAATGEDCPLEPGIRHVLLVPSTVLRPAVHRFDHHDTKILVVPVADASLAVAADTGAPPQQLMQLLRAVADERRLRILQRLSRSDARVADLARHTGMPATTLLHHLGILRAAGLVQPGPDDRGYTLRPDPLHDLPDALIAWLDIGGDS
jgi:ArsR family transcriptional regulator, cadmium/lead-responsive transcriptional repressor